MAGLPSDRPSAESGRLTIQEVLFNLTKLYATVVPLFLQPLNKVDIGRYAAKGFKFIEPGKQSIFIPYVFKGGQIGRPPWVKMCQPVSGKFKN
jgi:hypothetical protein